MSTSEVCFNNVTLFDPADQIDPCDGSNFDYSLFTSIDLTAYGGGIVEVSSDQDIIDAFQDLGISVFIEGCLIYILTGTIFTNIPVCGYLIIDLVDPNQEIDICEDNLYNYDNFTYVDFSQFGGSWTEVDEDSDIIDTLASLGITATIVGCDIILTTCSVYTDMAVRQDLYITIVDTDEGIVTCTSGEFNYNNFDAIDLSFYGGPDEVDVTSNSDVINAFATLGIEAEINGCQITLVNYTEDVQDIEACRFSRINIVDSQGNPLCDGNTIDFDAFNQVNFTPYGGTLTPISNSTQLINTLQSLVGVGVSIDGCDIVIHDCETVEIDLLGTSGDCVNCEFELLFISKPSHFRVTLQVYMDALIGANYQLNAGDLMRVEFIDEDDTVVSFANTVIGQNWSTPAGISGTSLNWLGATGFSSFTFMSPIDPSGGVQLDPGNLLAGLPFYFAKREWAIANSAAGVGVGQDYKIKISFPNLSQCDTPFEQPILKVTEGRYYQVELMRFIASEDDETCCTSTQNGTDIPVGLFDDRYFDDSTLEVFDGEDWIPAVVQPSDGVECAPGMQLHFPDPDDPILRHVCLDPYSQVDFPSGMRMNMQNHPNLIANVIGFNCVAKGHIENPQVITNGFLAKFATLTPNPFPKNVGIVEYNFHYHNINFAPLSATCPYNMIRADVYVANLPGLMMDPNDGQKYTSGVPVDPITPSPPGTNQNEYENTTQQHPFPTEGVYAVKFEFERGPNCENFSGNWNDPGCDICNGGLADDFNEDGEITPPEELTAYKIGLYIITSY